MRFEMVIRAIASFERDSDLGRVSLRSLRLSGMRGTNSPSRRAGGWTLFFSDRI